jgi:hypothetical protein
MNNNIEAMVRRLVLIGVLPKLADGRCKGKICSVMVAFLNVPYRLPCSSCSAANYIQLQIVMKH